MCTLTMFVVFFFFSSRRRHTRFDCDWSSDVCSSDLEGHRWLDATRAAAFSRGGGAAWPGRRNDWRGGGDFSVRRIGQRDRKSTRLNSSHSQISYAVFCLKKKKKHPTVLAPTCQSTT